MIQVKIEESWREALAPEFEKPYFEELVRKLHEEKAAGCRIYPPGGQIFRAFDLCPLPDVKVVILGQDPYHGYGQAMGLSFSVPDGVPAPDSEFFFHSVSLLFPAARLRLCRIRPRTNSRRLSWSVRYGYLHP